jgi:GDP-D-mannose dehydratase
MRKALVTGGAGFIGSHLVDALVGREVAVTVLDDLSTGKKENLRGVLDQITFIEGCVSEGDTVMEAAEGADTIFHLAAVASVQKSVEDPLATHKVNTGGTLSVFEAARRAGSTSRRWCMRHQARSTASFPDYRRAKRCSAVRRRHTDCIRCWAKRTRRSITSYTVLTRRDCVSSTYSVRGRTRHLRILE